MNLLFIDSSSSDDPNYGKNYSNLVDFRILEVTRLKMMKFGPNLAQVEVRLRLGSNSDLETLPNLIVEVPPVKAKVGMTFANLSGNF